MVNQDAERLEIHRSFRKPHPLRLPAEAMLEICDTPSHLGDLIPIGSQWQNGVVVGLRHGVPHPVTLHVSSILVNNHL
jgi:hypothetical protein